MILHKKINQLFFLFACNTIKQRISEESIFYYRTFRVSVYSIFKTLKEQVLLVFSAKKNFCKALGITFELPKKQCYEVSCSCFRSMGCPINWR